MIKVTRIGHATFETPDVERQIAYFTDIVGLVLAERDGDRAFLATRLGDLVVQLEKGPAPRCARISFQVAPETDFADLRRGLEAEGVKSDLRPDPSPGIDKALTFADPKGTLIEAFTAARPFERTTPPSGVGPYRLGHLAFCGEDPKAFAAFHHRALVWWRDAAARRPPVQARASRVLRRRSEGICRFLRPRARLPRVGLDRGLVRVHALRPRSPHDQFRLGQDHAHAPHRVRAQGLAARADRVRLSRSQEHSHHLGAGPARAGPQSLHLSPQSGRPDHRAVHRARQDAGRVARLFRSAAVAPRHAAEPDRV